MIKVSVVIPCYNVEKYLEDCLRSLLAQTLQEVEFIFVDDGSMLDGTSLLLDSFCARDPRIRVIHEENRGLGGARNAGIKASRGEYVGFVDADDTISPNYYELLYDAATRHGADIACTSIFRTRKNGSGHWRMKVDAEKVFTDKAELFEKVWNIVVTRIYRRSLFEDPSLLFREHVFYEDMIFSVPVLYAANKVVMVSGGVYYYAYTPGSIVLRRQTLRMQHERYEALMFQRRFFLNHGLALPGSLRSIRKWELRVGGISIIKCRDCGRYNVIKLFDIIPVWVKINKYVTNKAVCRR